MGEVGFSAPEPVLPIAGLLACNADVLASAVALLERQIGPARFRSASYRWSFSRYYEPEMGKVLFRQFVGLDVLLPADALPSLKAQARRIEAALSAFWEGKARRRVNVDPGYIDPGKLALASGKFAAHRLYLGQGVFAEVTLLFAGGKFRALATTYRDYSEARALRFFEELREHYLQALRRWHRAGCPRPAFGHALT